jgi:hypothetical protein
MEGHGRSPEERAAAREAGDRARIAREQGLTPESEEERVHQRSEPEGGWEGPDLDSMSRYGGGPSLPDLDVYQRRRLIAIGAAVVVVLLLFLLVVGC